MSQENNKQKTRWYKTSDGARLKGVWVRDVVGIPLTFMAKRPYQWGKKSGVAVRVKHHSGREGIVEVTQSILVRQLNSKKFSDVPYQARFVKCVSKNNREYYIIERLNNAPVNT